MGLGTKANETEGEGQCVGESQNWEVRCMHRLAAIYVAQTAGKTKFTNHPPSIMESDSPFYCHLFSQIQQQPAIRFLIRQN